MKSGKVALCVRPEFVATKTGESFFEVEIDVVESLGDEIIRV